MPRLAAHGKDKNKLELDADVKLTHYRLQKVGEQQLDLENAEVVKLPGIGEAGTGSAPEDEKKALREIVAKMNDLFSGHITESDFIGAVTAWEGHLAKSEKLAAQARNNSEEQFAMGDFKDAFTGHRHRGAGCAQPDCGAAAERRTRLRGDAKDDGEKALAGLSTRGGCAMTTEGLTAIFFSHAAPEDNRLIWWGGP